MSETSKLSFTIRTASAREVLDLRHRVLRAGLPREEASFDGDDGSQARHFAALDQTGAVVGCATIMPSDWKGKPAWRLRGMAVEEGWRLKGVGGALLRAIETSIAPHAELPAPQLWCNARTPAVEFYKRNGWVIASEEFDIETAGPHFRMTRTTSDRCTTLGKAHG